LSQIENNKIVSFKKNKEQIESKF